MGCAVAAALLLWPRGAAHGTAGVLDSPLPGVEPRRIEASWTFAPRLLFRFSRYPLSDTELEFRFSRADPEPLLTREGAAVGAEGRVAVRVIEEQLLVLHRRHGRGFADTLVRARLREALARMVAKEGYAGLRALGVLAVEGRLLADLRPLLEAEGVALAGLRLERLDLGAADPGGQALGRPARTANILLVGFDGADWNVIDPLRSRGRLPNLDAILRRGVGARLRTLTPVLSPVLWTSIATGKRPEKHGILDFLATSRDTGERIPVTSNLRRARPLWLILGDHGVRSNVVAWWATWPAERLAGDLVTDRVAYQLFGVENDREDASGKTYPPELYQRLRPLVRAPGDITDADLQAFIPELRSAGLEKRYPDLIREFRGLLASDRSYTEIALRLVRQEPARFSAVYLEGIDTVSHLFMRYRPPRAEGVSEAEVRWFGQVVDRFYQHEDQVLGRLLEAAGPAATVMVVSDHGFKSERNRPPGDARIGAGRAAEWHRKYGILAMAGPEIAAGSQLEDASILDIAPTVLALFDLPVADDFDGRVLETALEPGYRERHPARSVATYEPAVMQRAPENPIASGSDSAIRQKLAALGYLALEGSNAHNNRGTLFLSEGRSDEAIAAFEEALRLDADFLPVRINLGRAYLQKRDLGRALEILRDALRRKPDLPDVENLIGNILMDRGDHAGAEARFRRAVAIDANFTDAHNSLGILYEKLGRLADAERAYTAVTRIDPDYAEAYNNLGNVLRARGAWEHAVRQYQRAIAADPDFHGSYNNLGLAYQDRGMTAEAERAVRQGLEKAPRNAVLHSTLGSLHYAAGRHAEAAAEFERAVKLDPAYAEGFNNLGVALGALGRLQEQEAAYRKAIELHPGYADARHNLALALAARGDRAGALAELREAVEGNPAHVGAWLQAAALYEQEGAVGEAIQALENAKNADPLRPEIYNRLGELYRRVGQSERARREWRRSLELIPDQPRVRERLGGARQPGP